MPPPTATPPPTPGAGPQGCVEFKAGNWDDARAMFTEAIGLRGGRPELRFNLALCLYRARQYAPALKLLAEIIEQVGVTLCV